MKSILKTTLLNTTLVFFLLSPFISNSQEVCHSYRTDGFFLAQFKYGDKKTDITLAMKFLEDGTSAYSILDDQTVSIFSDNAVLDSITNKLNQGKKEKLDCESEMFFFPADKKDFFEIHLVSGRWSDDKKKTNISSILKCRVWSNKDKFQEFDTKFIPDSQKDRDSERKRIELAEKKRKEDLLKEYTTYKTKLKFHIADMEDVQVHLVRYYGKKLYYADTAELINGMVVFEGTKQKPGLFALMLPGQKLLEFVYNNEEVEIESKLPDLLGNEKVKKSKENELFVPYMILMRESTKNSTEIREKMPEREKDSVLYDKLFEEIQKINKEIEEYQLKLIAEHEDFLLAKIVKLSMDIKIPDAPVDDNGNILDSNFAFKYYFEHYWDNCDFNDDRLVNSSVFQNKLEVYFSKRMMVQHWDTIIKNAYQFCDALPKGSTMFEFCVSWITSNYEKSQIMGMDKVFVFMGKKYYCPDPAGFTFMNEKHYCLPDENGDPPAFWMPAKNLEKLCEKVTTNFNLVMGQVPPPLILLDSTEQNWINYMDLESDYTILYFWDPNCGHCKKITPKLQTLYEKKFRDRNIEIYAVGKAVEDDFEDWKKFIREHNLEFINVGLTKNLYKQAKADPRPLLNYTTLESLNYSQTFDVFKTPKVWVLDKDKKIIAYSLQVWQLEEMLDRLTGHEEDEKVCPPEKDPDDEQMH